MTKAEALKHVDVFTAGFADRVILQLDNGARSGALGGDFPYGNLADKDVDPAVTRIQGLGYSVVKDTLNKKLVVT